MHDADTFTKQHSNPNFPPMFIEINQEWIDTYIKQIQTLKMEGIPQQLKVFC